MQSGYRFALLGASVLASLALALLHSQFYSSYALVTGGAAVFSAALIISDWESMRSGVYVYDDGVPAADTSKDFGRVSNVSRIGVIAAFVRERWPQEQGYVLVAGKSTTLKANGIIDSWKLGGAHGRGRLAVLNVDEERRLLDVQSVYSKRNAALLLGFSSGLIGVFRCWE